MSFLLGGLRFREQVYNGTVAKISASLLALSVMSLLLPTAFHSSFSSETRADDKVLLVSRGTSVIVLLVYVLYLIFQLKSHSYIYATPHEADESTTVPGPAAQYFHHTEAASPTPDSSTPAHTAATGNGPVAQADHGSQAEDPSDPPEHESQNHQEAAHRQETNWRRRQKQVTVEEPKPALEQGERGTGDHSDFAAAPALEAQSASPVTPGLSRVPSLTRRLGRRPGDTVSTSTGRSSRTRRSKSEPGSRPFPGHRNLDPTMPPMIPASVYRTPTPQPRHRRGSSNDNTDNNNTPTNNEKNNTDPAQPHSHPSPLPAITLLLLTTTLVALLAEFMVSSIDTLVATSAGLSEAFIGLILLPLVGNAAEHATAVRVALKNKMDLAVGVAVGSSIQIALFVTPLVVILGWVMARDMGLFFTLFETVCVFGSAFIVNFLVLDGRSNYLEGALLCAAYVIVAVAAFFYPDVKAANELGGAD